MLNTINIPLLVKENEIEIVTVLTIGDIQYNILY